MQFHISTIRFGVVGRIANRYSYQLALWRNSDCLYGWRRQCVNFGLNWTENLVLEVACTRSERLEIRTFVFERILGQGVPRDWSQYYSGQIPLRPILLISIPGRRLKRVRDTSPTWRLRKGGGTGWRQVSGQNKLDDVGDPRCSLAPLRESSLHVCWNRYLIVGWRPIPLSTEVLGDHWHVRLHAWNSVVVWVLWFDRVICVRLSFLVLKVRLFVKKTWWEGGPGVGEGGRGMKPNKFWSLVKTKISQIKFGGRGWRGGPGGPEWRWRGREGGREGRGGEAVLGGPG